MGFLPGAPSFLDGIENSLTEKPQNAEGRLERPRDAATAFGDQSLDGKQSGGGRLAEERRASGVRNSKLGKVVHN
jgi:hypothetical protein